jgi:FK506-binding protein 2
MALASKSAEQLQIGVKYKPDECPLKTRNGDRLSMQYVTILT